MGLSVKIYIVVFVAVFSVILFQGQHHYVFAGGIGFSEIPVEKTDFSFSTGEVVPGTGDESRFASFVTPENWVVRNLADGFDSPEEAYYAAVGWVYVDEKTLNGVADWWLTPEEFLIGTRDFPTNPLKGKPVSDCEEKANTLVSVIRALGVPPDEVRVAAGKVLFDGKEVGHVWAELSIDGKWLPLDPTSGPYWNEKKGKLVNREGLPFDYYSGQEYPVLKVWTYYNDIYCLDLQDGSGDYPGAWSDTGAGFPSFFRP